jgi:hypothetical protein
VILTEAVPEFSATMIPVFPAPVAAGWITQVFVVVKHVPEGVMYFCTATIEDPPPPLVPQISAPVAAEKLRWLPPESGQSGKAA